MDAQNRSRGMQAPRSSGDAPAEMSNVVTTLDLLRHGEPVGGKKYRGQIDDPLSDKGWNEMWATVGTQCPWTVVLSSPLSRCADFARELTGRHGLPLELEPRLKELGFGEWEGRSASELLSQDPLRLARFWQDPIRHSPPGGESLVDFRERVISVYHEVLTRHAGKHVLVVCHAGVIRLLLSQALGMPLDHLFRIEVPSAAISRLRVERSAAGLLPRLVFHAGCL